MCLPKNIRYLRKKKNYSQEDLANILGYKSYTTIQKWEMGISEPPIAKLRKMAELFEADINDMATVDIEKKEASACSAPDAPAVQKSAQGNGYYLNEETAKAAQEIFENPDMRILFEAARGSRPEDLQTAADILRRFKETNPDG